LEKLHLIREGFVAEIVRGRATGLYHFLITRENSLEILCWGQENTLEAARHSVDEFIMAENTRFRSAS
jgi:hypothetical protein